jgi:tRNA(adenine34) deaminase
MVDKGLMGKRDEEFMMKCLLLAEKAHEKGDMPFGCLITKGGKILVKSENYVIKDNDVTNHAEIVAMRSAQKILKTTNLSECDIFCSSEPCPMCSFMIRELRFKRVIFSLPSPIMGGYTKYKILQDGELNVKFPHHFGPVPEIVSGILHGRASEVWQKREELKKKGMVKKVI